MDHKRRSSLTSHHQSKTNRAAARKLVRSGQVSVRERGTFSGTSWRPMKLELDSEVLTIIRPSSNKRTQILLNEITELERTDLADHSLGLTAKQKRFNFSFASDSELYDWQDDIYKLCPLGNYSAPFDFVHKSHIGSDTVTGTFDRNVLPIYAEIIGAQPTNAKSAIVAPRSRPASGTIVVAPRSRPPSGGPLGPITKASSSGSGTILLEGRYMIKETGLFAGWLWKDRWVSLTSQGLVIHRQAFKASSASKKILLPALTRVEPDVKRHNCLVVEFTTGPSSSSSPSTDNVSIVFPGNSELYTWRDEMYLRSGLSSPIGRPTNFVHLVHVGFDPSTGAFTGLPTDWQGILNPTTPPRERKVRRQSRRKPAPLVQPASA